MTTREPFNNGESMAVVRERINTVLVDGTIPIRGDGTAESDVRLYYDEDAGFMYLQEVESGAWVVRETFLSSHIVDMCLLDGDVTSYDNCFGYQRDGKRTSLLRPVHGFDGIELGNANSLVSILSNGAIGVEYVNSEPTFYAPYAGDAELYNFIVAEGNLYANLVYYIIQDANTVVSAIKFNCSDVPEDCGIFIKYEEINEDTGEIISNAGSSGNWNDIKKNKNNMPAGVTEYTLEYKVPVTLRKESHYKITIRTTGDMALCGETYTRHVEYGADFYPSVELLRVEPLQGEVCVDGSYEDGKEYAVGDSIFMSDCGTGCRGNFECNVAGVQTGSFISNIDKWDNVLKIQPSHGLRQQELGSITPENEVGKLYMVPSTGDGIDGYTTSMLRFNGEEGSTTFIDSVAERKTSVVGSPYLSESPKKFGTSSIYFDGASGLNVENTDIVFPEGSDFTFDGWIYPTDITGVKPIICQYKDEDEDDYWALKMVDDMLTFDFVIKNKTKIEIASDIPIPANAWTHVAVERLYDETTDDYDYKVFVNGVGTIAHTARQDASWSTWMQVGFDGHTATFFEGNIDELRTSIGIARYDEDFTPPTKQYGIGLYFLTGEGVSIELSGKVSGGVVSTETVYGVLEGETAEGHHAFTVPLDATEMDNDFVPYYDSSSNTVKFKQLTSSNTDLSVDSTMSAPRSLLKTKFDAIEEALVPGATANYFGENIFEPATSATANCGGSGGTYTVTASSEFSSFHSGWKAFDQSSGEWATDAVTADFSLTISFSVPKQLHQLDFERRDTGYDEYPFFMTILGGTEGNPYITLATVDLSKTDGYLTSALNLRGAMSSYKIYCHTAGGPNPGLKSIKGYEVE